MTSILAFVNGFNQRRTIAQVAVKNDGALMITNLFNVCLNHTYRSHNNTGRKLQNCKKKDNIQEQLKKETNLRKTHGVYHTLVLYHIQNFFIYCQWI